MAKLSITSIFSKTRKKPINEKNDIPKNKMSLLELEAFVPKKVHVSNSNKEAKTAADKYFKKADKHFVTGTETYIVPGKTAYRNYIAYKNKLLRKKTK